MIKMKRKKAFKNSYIEGSPQTRDIIKHGGFRKLIKNLKGSDKDLYMACNDLGYYVNEFGDKQLEVLHSKLFVCTNCGYWHDADTCTKYDGERLCLDCFRNEVDEDDEEICF